MQVQFKQWLCNVKFATYTNGNRTAIQLKDAEDGQPVATATVNMPDYNLMPNEVIIKNYSENEGMTDALVKAGVIHMPHAHARSGFITADVCLLTDEALKFVQ